jgi:RNA recognition motif-containing protein
MSTRLFVGNVAYNLDEQGLTDAFAQLGLKVENVKIARDKETHRPRGFAFIETEDATAEALLTQGVHIAGRDLRIERSTKQPGDDVRDRRPGGGGGDRRPGGGGGGNRGGRRGGGGGGGRADDGEAWRDERHRGARR